MFKQKLRVFIPILSLILLLGFTLPSKAAQFESGDYTLEQTEIVEENLYIEGQTVDISGVVDGDLFIAGGNISISGTVTGDVYLTSNRTDISGNIYGSAFLAGQRVDISGSIARNAVVAGMYSDMSGSIGKDLTVFASNSTITGRVTEDVRFFGNRSTISGIVKGEVLLYGRNSTIDQESVEGEIYENINEEDWKINMPDVNVWKGMKRNFLSVNIFSTLIGFVSMYIVGVILIYLAPIKTLKIEEKVIGSVQEFLFSFLVGLGITVFIPLPLMILAFTIIGAPLAFLITGLLLFAAIFGTLWVESAIGYKILSASNKEDNKRLLSLLVGRGLTTVVNLIPIVRGLYKSVLSMVAIGAIVRMKYDAYKVSRGTKKSKSKKK